MGNVTSGKLISIQPQQFETLLKSLEAKTPPKPQTLFSIKEVIARLDDVITQALENHYSFDELAPIIRDSLLESHLVEALPELKGSTLKQYYLEVQRERQITPPRKRKSPRSKNAPKGRSKPQPKNAKQRKSKTPIPIAESPIQNVDRPPQTQSDKIELAY